MNKLLAILCLLSAAPTFAADIPSKEADIAKQQQELEQNLNQMSQEIVTGIQTTSRTMQQAIPLFSEHFQEIIRVFNQEMVPVIQALEDNKRLLTANPKMGKSLQNSLPKQYRSDSQYNINPQINELSVSGEATANDNSLKYNISRNLAAATITQSFITKINTLEEAKDHKQPLPNIDLGGSILNLDNQKLDSTRFKLEQINNLVFLSYADEEKKEGFMVGNLTPELNIRVQTSGPEYQNTARKFIKSLDINKLQKAVNQK